MSLRGLFRTKERPNNNCVRQLAHHRSRTSTLLQPRIQRHSVDQQPRSNWLLSEPPCCEASYYANRLLCRGKSFQRAASQPPTCFKQRLQGLRSGPLYGIVSYRIDNPYRSSRSFSISVWLCVRRVWKWRSSDNLLCGASVGKAA